MRAQYRILALAGITFVAACDDATAPAPSLPTAPTPLTSVTASPGDEYIVVLRSTQSDVKGSAARLAGAHRGRLKRTWQHVLKGFVAELPAAEIKALQARSEVVSVERNGVVQMSNQVNPPWGLDRIDQRKPGGDNLYAYNWTGLGVHVYIIDSGIRATHLDFGGRVSGGETWVVDGNGTGDCNGHGTHVASVIGGSMTGVAKGVSLHPVRVFGCVGGAPIADVIEALEWVELNDVAPAVTNLSLGGALSPALNAAVNGLVATGNVVVAAAGNSSGNACNYSPASAVDALTVGATDVTDTRPAFSNAGPCLDFFAPGVDIMGASHLNNFGRLAMTGTSLSSAFVAGAAAKIRQHHPGWPPAAVRAELVATATLGAVIGAGGAPNRLLFSR